MITEEEIEAAKTPNGGWTKAQLAKWGIPWPPPSGWKKGLLYDGAIQRITILTEALWELGDYHDYGPAADYTQGVVASVLGPDWWTTHRPADD